MDTMETVALDQAEIIEKLIKMNKNLISELAQVRVMDEEEKMLADLIERMGGGLIGNTDQSV